MSESAKVSYNATTWRVKCEFTRQACLASELPPADLVVRARTKLESVKSAGDIAFYVVFETRLNEVWRAMREAIDEPTDRRVQITLAAGAPLMAGIKIEKPLIEKSIASLSIDVPREIANAWRYEPFKVMIAKRLRDAGIKEAANNAQVYAAFCKMRNGEKVLALPLGSGSPAAFPANGKAFSVVANKLRMEIGVVIRNVPDMRVKSNRDAMLTLLNQAVKQMSTEGAEYKLLKKDFLIALQSALEGPEGLGIDTPLILLAAVGAMRESKSNHAGAGRIRIDVAKDRSSATIAGFQLAYYDDPTFQVSVEWLQNELQRCHITAPMDDEIVRQLSDAIKTKQGLDGMLVAKGSPGAGGRGPYVHHSYKDAAAKDAGNLDEANLDMREMQQRSTVNKGQLVAEIVFAEAAVAGVDVYGEEVKAPADEELVTHIGEGILQRGLKFYATFDGLPVIENGSVGLTKAMVHNGDVNLRTGNIRFDGPVEIKGSIDSGAVVETTGDLLVHGTIRSGHVRCGGNLDVKSGVVTGTTGSVIVRGSMTAEFIENSRITCGGDLVVVKAIINSEVIAGGQIRVSSKAGVVAGGRLVSRKSLITHNLGFRRGALTILEVGVDWKWAKAVHTRKSRLERVQKRSAEDRQALRELVQKSKAQMTQRHVEMKEELQERLQRMRSMIERAEIHLAKANASLTYDPTSRVYVHELLSANVAMTLAGQSIGIVNDVIGVAVLSKRRRGQYVVPIEEIEAEDKAASGMPMDSKAG